MLNDDEHYWISRKQKATVMPFSLNNTQERKALI